MAVKRRSCCTSRQVLGCNCSLDHASPTSASSSSQFSSVCRSTAAGAAVLGVRCLGRLRDGALGRRAATACTPAAHSLLAKKMHVTIGLTLRSSAEGPWSACAQLSPTASTWASARCRQASRLPRSAEYAGSRSHSGNLGSAEVSGVSLALPDACCVFAGGAPAAARLLTSLASMALWHRSGADRKSAGWGPARKARRLVRRHTTRICMFQRLQRCQAAGK